MNPSTARVTVAHPRWVAIVHKAARACALGGGVLICLMAALVVVSIVGRELLRRPIPGDFEIVAFGMAVAACLCLPYCQLTRGNLVVDFFLSGAPPRFRSILDGIAAAVFGALALVIGWRMVAGMLDAIAYRDISMIVGLPIWWYYPFAICSFFLLAAACLVTALRDWGGRPW